MGRQPELSALLATPPGLAYAVAWPGGQTATFRPLHRDDADRLAAYFAGLSAATIARFRPHDFTRAVAQTLCEQVDDGPLRLVAITGQGDAAAVVAYFILFGEIAPSTHARYLSYGLPLDPATDGQFAPSVADAYQGLGAGSGLMPPCLDIARRAGYRRLLLLGGVYLSNRWAIRFYEKHGFRAVGTFGFGEKESADMILSLG